MSPIDFNGLDTIVHGPIRLGALAALQVDGTLDFSTLKKRLEVADGALGGHLAKLEGAGYISVRKAFVGKRPRTTYKLTVAGRRALSKYFVNMRLLLDSIEERAGGPGSSSQGRF